MNQGNLLIAFWKSLKIYYVLTFVYRYMYVSHENVNIVIMMSSYPLILYNTFVLDVDFLVLDKLGNLDYRCCILY